MGDRDQQTTSGSRRTKPARARSSRQTVDLAERLRQGPPVPRSRRGGWARGTAAPDGRERRGVRRAD